MLVCSLIPPATRLPIHLPGDLDCTSSTVDAAELVCHAAAVSNGHPCLTIIVKQRTTPEHATLTLLQAPAVSRQLEANELSSAHEANPSASAGSQDKIFMSEPLSNHLEVQHRQELQCQCLCACITVLHPIPTHAWFASACILNFSCVLSGICVMS